MTITHDAWTSLYRLPPSGGQEWRPVQTCSLEDPPPWDLPSGGRFKFRHVQSVQANITHPTGMPSCSIIASTIPY